MSNGEGGNDTSQDPIAVTREDVAREAGVSTATVSRVFNNAAYIKPATRERVLKVARRLKYRPNQIARGLTTRRMSLIGVLIPHVTDGFQDQVLQGIESVARSEGYSTLIGVTNYDTKREHQIVQDFIGLRVAGLVVCPAHRTRSVETFREVQHLGVPLVFIVRHLPGLRSSLVINDDVHAGYTATKHLLETGARRIGIMIAENLEGETNLEDREKGYRQALAEAGLEYDSSLRRVVPKGDEEEASKELISQGIDGLFATHDTMAMNFFQAAEGVGVRVPDDIAVVGHDGILWSEMTRPTLSTMSVDKVEIGRRATKILLEQINSSADNVLHSIMLKPTLAVRQSSLRVPDLRSSCDRGVS